MKRKILSLALALSLAAAMLSGCGSAETKEATEATTEAVTVEETEEVTEQEATADDATAESGEPTQDRSGNSIVVPEDVKTIVSMAPSTTRILIDLGLADKVIAVDTNSYAYLASLPSVKQEFDMMAPDNEALVALQPDIVFTSGMSSYGGEDAFQSVRDAGICVADIPSSASFADIADDIIFIGDCVGKTAEAETLVADMNSTIDSIKAVADTIETKKTVLFEISIPSADYPTIYSVGTGTFIDEMITGIGATNITGDQESWISLSEEEAVALNPDVIVTNVNYVDDVLSVIKTSAGWENVTAIKNGEVYYIDADASNQPNNHVVDAMIQMAKQVYPEAFADFADPFAAASEGDAE